MAENVTVDPRYLSYDKADVEALLQKVEHPDTAPTAESDSLITSGGVKAAIDETKEEMTEALGDYATKQSVEAVVAAMPTLETNDDPASLLEEDSSDSTNE